MIFFKLVLLQLFWFYSVKYSFHPYSFLFLPFSILLLWLNYKFYKVTINAGKYISLIFLFGFWGILQDGLLHVTGSVKFPSSTYWLNSLWLIFLVYYGDVFNRLSRVNKYLQGLIGGFAGCLTYWTGSRLGNMEIIDPILFVLIIFSSWFVFMPISLRLFYNNSIWNWLLDRSVYFSFDSSGFVRHAQEFISIDGVAKSLVGKRVLVTGGTRGIGKSVCDTLIYLGAKVEFTGRNEDKGKKLNKEDKTFKKLDLVDWQCILSFTKDCEPFDGIVLNAGGMPNSLLKNDEGVEHQAASQLFGHFYLIELLRLNNKLNKGCRITWVSSGGMYLKQLDIPNLVSPMKYDKVEVYANVKRAQVTLVEELANRKDWDQYIISAMHPGWVATEGIKEAIPGFYKFTKNRLRSLKQGADTINWLQFTNEEISSGSFYFDRKKVSPYVFKKDNPSTSDREELLSLLEKYKKIFN